MLLVVDRDTLIGFYCLLFCFFKGIYINKYIGKDKCYLLLGHINCEQYKFNRTTLQIWSIYLKGILNPVFSKMNTTSSCSKDYSTVGKLSIGFIAPIIIISTVLLHGGIVFFEKWGYDPQKRNLYNM